MTTAANRALACIGEPISWLRLERHAIGPRAAQIDEHLAACPACKRCFDDLRADVVALPPLVVPGAAPKRARAWWQFAVPAFAAAAAALAIVVIIRRPAPSASTHALLAGVKGVGDVSLVLVRERRGAIRDDVATYAPGDRWKIAVTCAATGGAWLDLGVTEAGAASADRPLPPAHVACGNGVAMPGAFTITGALANTICVRVADRANGPDGRVACITVTPEAP